MDENQPQQKSDNFWSLLAAAVCAIALSMTALFAYQNFQLQKQLNSLLQTPVSTPTPIPDPTANWKTYTSEKFNFSVRYPPEANIATRDPDPFPVAVQIDNLKPRTGGGGGPLMEGWFMIISEPQNKISTQTLDEWGKLKHLIYVSDPSTGKDIEQATKQISISGRKTITWTGPEAYRYYLVEKDSERVVFIMINMGDTTSGISPIFNQILSTFTFLVDDRVVGVNINQCCPCPEKISPSMVGKGGWLVYNQGKDYSKNIPASCSTVLCKPCEPVSDL